MDTEYLACSADFHIMWTAERLRGHLILSTPVSLAPINQNTLIIILGNISQCKTIQNPRMISVGIQYE